MPWQRVAMLASHNKQYKKIGFVCITNKLHIWLCWVVFLKNLQNKKTWGSITAFIFLGKISLWMIIVFSHFIMDD
jgi:hypothetical protein